MTETVFSDPVGAKLQMMTDAMGKGYSVVLLFIGISSPERSDERVAMRVSQGGHDVPEDRIVSRYPRTLANLKKAIPLLSTVRVYDNDDLNQPYRLLATFVEGEQTFVADELPNWFASILQSLHLGEDDVNES